VVVVIRTEESGPWKLLARTAIIVTIIAFAFTLFSLYRIHPPRPHQGAAHRGDVTATQP
jgi:hypothetical protein